MKLKLEVKETERTYSVPAVFDDYVKRLISIEVLDEENANPTEEAVTSES